MFDLFVRFHIDICLGNRFDEILQTQRSGKMLNIVLPMAGRGSRFAEAGYAVPKPFIPIHGVPMVKVVVDNLAPKREHRFIFVCQQAHIDEYDLAPKLKSYAKNVEIIGR
jgi:UTP-glucose-1-phosphate uridylyltransferase